MPIEASVLTLHLFLNLKLTKFTISITSLSNME